MQIPIAMLMERFGVRLILFISVLICSLGCFLMAITSTWPIAVLSRFLIGIGSVSGFLGTTKVIVDHFDSKYHATMIGFSMSFGLLGTLFGGKPIISMVHTYSWQKVSCAFGLMNGVIALLAWGVMKNKKKSSNKSENEYFSLSVVLSILKNKTFLTIAIANFLMEGCLGGFADVWGQQYLRLAFDIDKSQASWLTSSIFLGMLFGPPLLSLLAQKTHAHFKITGFCGLLMAGIFSTLLLGHDKIHAMWFVQIIMLILGALSGYQVLVFVIGESLFPKNLSNISIATLNCINLCGGTFFHSCGRKWPTYL
jgi:MFS family permease